MITHESRTGAADERLRIGVVLDFLAVNAWQARALRELTESGDAVVSLVVIQGADATRSPSGAIRRRSLGTRLAARALDVFATRLSRAGAEQAASEVPWPSDVPIMRATDPAARTAQTPALDVLLHLGTADPAPLLRMGPRLGVWSYRHGSLSTASRAPLGFQELLTRQPVVQAALLRWIDGATEAQVLRQGWFATAPASFALTRDRAWYGASAWPAQLCRRIRSGEASDDTHTWQASEVADATPGLGSTVRFLGQLVGARVRKLWHHGLRHDDWNIGIIDAPVETLLSASTIAQVDWAPVRDGHYAADPFGRWQGTSLEVAYEDYIHDHGRASIIRRFWDRTNGWRSPQPMLDVGSHLSYPFLLEYQGRRLMLPESQASGKLVLYEQDGDASTWQPRSTLDVSGEIADATLLEHDGRWWLFASRADRMNPATDLMLWFADAPDGPWHAHPQSPVLTDVRSARPGGPCFVADGRLYRPAQDCSTGYGDRLAIRRVLTLTTERYAEETATILRPDPNGPFPYGLHTLTGVGDVTLVDGKRRVRHTAATLRAIRARLPI